MPEQSNYERAQQKSIPSPHRLGVPVSPEDRTIFALLAIADELRELPERLASAYMSAMDERSHAVANHTLRMMSARDFPGDTEARRIE